MILTYIMYLHIYCDCFREHFGSLTVDEIVLLINMRREVSILWENIRLIQ